MNYKDIVPGINPLVAIAAMMMMAAPRNKQGGRVVSMPKKTKFSGVGRNDPCPCGSGLKFKRCKCYRKQRAA